MNWMYLFGIACGSAFAVAVNVTLHWLVLWRRPPSAALPMTDKERAIDDAYFDGMRPA